jgi:oxygen-independent coproporphyrinogen-3 oxidase
VRGLEAWLEGGAAEHERLDGDRAAAEGLWLGLRRLTGVDVQRFCEKFRVSRAWVEARVRRQVELENLCWEDEGRVLRVGDGRWLWHDSIALGLLDG